MALARAVVDGLLETDVLLSPKEIEGAERSRGIRRVEQKRSYHSPRACYPQTIGCRPARRCKRVAELLMRADQGEIDGVAWQTVTGDRVSGDELAVKNLQAHPDHVWQNNIGSQPVCKAHRQDPWKSVVRSIEDDEDDQPNGSDAQAKDEKPLEKARKQSQNS